MNDLDPEEFEKVKKSTSLEFSHTKLRDLWPIILQDYEAISNCKLGISCTYRSPRAQYELWKIGREVPPLGKRFIITNCDGFKTPSRHNLSPSRAIDVYVYHPSGKITWDIEYYKLLGPIMNKLGLKWGGNFKGLVDMPHIEID